jgi:uncharacterized protein
MTPRELLRAASSHPYRHAVVRARGEPARLAQVAALDPAGAWLRIMVGDAHRTLAAEELDAVGPYAPPRLTRLPLDAQRRVPWKNGLGTTREVAVDPPDASAGGAFRWRVSLAWVDRSCPFSAFPGYDRTILLVSGEGFTLDFGGAAPPRTLTTLLDRCEFQGEWTTSCALVGGAVEDLNVMVDRARARARVEVLRYGAQRELEGETAIGVALGGRVSVSPVGGAVMVLEAGDAVRLDRADPALVAEPVTVSCEREAALVLVCLGARA